MKRKALLLSLLFLLASCGEAASSSSDALFSSNEEGGSISSSQYVPSTPWGYDFSKACYENLDYVIPYIEADEFEFTVGLDSYGDPLVTAYLYYETDELCEAAFEEYASVCAGNGAAVTVGENTYFDYENFSIITYPIAYADIRIAEYKAVEIMSSPSTYKGRPCLGLFAFNYLYIPETEWPEKAIEEVIGTKVKVPAIEGEGITYSFSLFIEEYLGHTAAEIYVKNVYLDVEEVFFNLLKEAGWSLYLYEDYDENYEEQVTEYPGFAIEYYYGAYRWNAAIYFDYNFDLQALVIDVYNIAR